MTSVTVDACRRQSPSWQTSTMQVLDDNRVEVCHDGEWDMYKIVHVTPE